MKKIIIFILCLSCVSGFCQGLDKKIKDGAKQKVEAELLEISKSPLSYTNKKIQELDNVINTLPDRKVKYEGNITMKEYLKQIKKDIQEKPYDYVIKRQTELLNIKAQLEVLDEEINKDTNISLPADNK